jgi:hypothetical protein
MVYQPKNGEAALRAYSSISTLPSPSLALSFKVPGSRKEGDTRVHGPLADPEVVIDPFLYAGRLFEAVCIHTGTISGEMSARVIRP